MTKSPSHQSCTSSGNAIVFILVAIALLAALTMSLTKMSSTSSGNLEPEQARMAAQQILSYAKSLDNAVQFVRGQNGCGQAQISFENTTEAGYANASAPGDKRCHVFDIAGGGLSWQAPPKNTTLANETWVVNGNGFSVTGFGTEGSGDCTTDCTDLILFAPNLDLVVCQQLNYLLGVTTSPDTTPPGINSPVIAANVATKFTGAYGGGVGTPIGHISATPLIYQKPSACVAVDTVTVPGPLVRAGTRYLFYSLLVAR